jgi:deoxyribonuclease-4
MRRIGVHTSIAGGISCSLERARELGATTLQIFSHNPRGWAVKKRDPKDIKAFKKLRRLYNICPVVIHTSYLINLATKESGLVKRSVEMMVQEMHIADEIGAEYVVLHTGSAAGDRPAAARKRAVDRLNEVAGRGTWKAGLLLENTAGERGDITSRIEDLAEITEQVPGPLIKGVCIDTCHAFAAGYDLRSENSVDVLSREIKSSLGKNRLRLIHLNDAKGRVGSGKDRHEHIGRGKIGKKGFRIFLNHPFFLQVPIILETPKKTERDDRQNLKKVRSLMSG